MRARVNVFLSLKLQTDFDGRLNARQVELLVQYLTVPYLRIPLVAKLLCDESRVRALASVDLQSVFDSVIFEPGPWRSPPKVCTIFCHIAQQCTIPPLGSIFNVLHGFQSAQNH